jgi:hypothetical protein
MTYIVTAGLAAQYGLSLDAAARLLIEPLQWLGLLVETSSSNGNGGLRYPPGPRPACFVEKLGKANRVVRDVLNSRQA